MARLMLSEGMFSAFAAATAVRKRGFFSASPPDFAAIVISLMRRGKILPRLASRAPFFWFIFAPLLLPGMTIPHLISYFCGRGLNPPTGAPESAPRGEKQQIITAQ